MEAVRGLTSAGPVDLAAGEVARHQEVVPFRVCSQKVVAACAEVDAVKNRLVRVHGVQHGEPLAGKRGLDVGVRIDRLARNLPVDRQHENLSERK